jgi:ammonia channel protein AmtB
VSADRYVATLTYIFACVGVLFDLLALTLLDASSVRRKNLIDTMTQRIIAAIIGGVAFFPIGYAIWNLQFYQALGVPRPLAQAISDWWFGGTYLTRFAQHIDPQLVPGADTQQVFLAYFIVFGAVTGAFIHSAGLERLKPLPCFIMSAIVGGLVVPLLTYLTYGPVGPLSNGGLHDFVGDYGLYIFVGCWALVLARRLGPRRGELATPDFTLFGMGIFFLLIGIPMFVVGCGFLQPGQGYFGITMTESGLGIVFVNVFAAFGGGAISGAIIGYRMRNPVYAVLGPISGYVACSALLDIAMPWQAMAVAFFAPFVTVGCSKLMVWAKIDEPKIVAIAMGPGIYGALAAGVVGHGLPTGGFFGIASGPYAFQHARISLLEQAIGVVVVVAISLAAAWVVVTLLDKTIGLRVSEDVEDMGLDAAYWLPANPGPAPVPASSPNANMADHPAL